MMHRVETVREKSESIVKQIKEYGRRGNLRNGDEELNRERHTIQQRRWRVGRGEGTEADHRADAQVDLLARYESRYT